MKMPKTLDNLFNNIYFLYFVSFLAVFNIFAYIIMNNFNAIILFILIGYITYLFSKNMAIVLLVALLLTNLFTGSNNNRMGREGFQEGLDASGNSTDSSGNYMDPSGNRPIAQKVKTAVQERKEENQDPTTMSTPSPAPGPSSMTPSMMTSQGMQNMQNFDMEKMKDLLSQSQKLMGDLKTAFPGMSNILGGLGQ